MALKIPKTSNKAQADDTSQATPAISLNDSILASRDEIAGIESAVEIIPAYYKTHIGKAKPHGVHSPNERARCFREATLLQLSQARGWLGKALGALGTPSPYPQSDNANSPIIEPPAYNKAPAMQMGDPVAALKSARASIANALDNIVKIGNQTDASVGRYISLSKTALESARLSLGEELGILGGY